MGRAPRRVRHLRGAALSGPGRAGETSPGRLPEGREALGSRVAVILCQPRSPANLGAVARAMANFGVTDLRLVDPCDPLDPEARRLAVEAFPLLERARLFPDLAAALADLQLSVAATRRAGRRRGRLLSTVELPGLAAKLPAEARIGLVFGREDRGLTSEEVALCSVAASVAGTAAFGSLNLAQAVLLFLYEISRQTPRSGEDRTACDELPDHEELEGVFALMAEVLERTAFLNPSRPEAVLNRLRQLILRARPDRGEAALLRGMWSQLRWSINDWRGRKRG